MLKDFSKLRIPKPKGEVKGYSALANWERELREKAAGPQKKKDWWIKIQKKWWLNDLKNLSPAERCVLITLKIHDNKKFGCFPSVRTMAQELHVSQTLILRAIKKLKKKGYFKIVKRVGRFNSYILKSEAC